MLLPVELIEEAKVTVNVQNDQGIANSTTFDNLKLSYKEDTVISWRWRGSKAREKMTLLSTPSLSFALIQQMISGIGVVDPAGCL